MPYIWVTGASSGIGKSLAVEFVKAGFSVFATARREEFLQQLDVEIDSDGLLTHPCDITDLGRVWESHRFLESRNGYVACLINNAGVTSFSEAASDSIETIETILKTNLNGAIYAIKTVLPEMLARNEGWIISILSVAAKKVFTQSSAYAASKLGLKGYTDVLREEVRQHKIKVVNVFPGATATPIWNQEILEQKASAMMESADIAKLLVQMYKANTSAVPEEIILKPVSGDL